MARVVPDGWEMLEVEQKSGLLAETPEGLVKAYPNKRKNVAAQIQRSVESLQSRFRHGHAGVGMALDYLLFCPDYHSVPPRPASHPTGSAMPARPGSSRRGSRQSSRPCRRSPRYECWVSIAPRPTPVFAEF